MPQPYHLLHPLNSTQVEQLNQMLDLLFNPTETLATIALILEKSDQTAWDNMTDTEKKTAVLEAADEWQTLRSFLKDL